MLPMDEGLLVFGHVVCSCGVVINNWAVVTGHIAGLLPTALPRCVCLGMLIFWATAMPLYWLVSLLCSSRALYAARVPLHFAKLAFWFGSGGFGADLILILWSCEHLYSLAGQCVQVMKGKAVQEMNIPCPGCLGICGPSAAVLIRLVVSCAVDITTPIHPCARRSWPFCC